MAPIQRRSSVDGICKRVTWMIVKSVNLIWSSWPSGMVRSRTDSSLRSIFAWVTCRRMNARGQSWDGLSRTQYQCCSWIRLECWCFSVNIVASLLKNTIAPRPAPSVHDTTRGRKEERKHVRLLRPAARTFVSSHTRGINSKCSSVVSNLNGQKG